MYIYDFGYVYVYAYAYQGMTPCHLSLLLCWELPPSSSLLPAGVSTTEIRIDIYMYIYVCLFIYICICTLPSVTFAVM